MVILIFYSLLFQVFLWLLLLILVLVVQGNSYRDRNHQFQSPISTDKSTSSKASLQIQQVSEEGPEAHAIPRIFVLGAERRNIVYI